MEAQERLGRRKSIRHFIVAYNCMKCYLDGEIITKEVSMVDSYDADYLACQMSHGDTDVFFGAVNYGSDVEMVTTIPAKSIEPEYVMVSSGLILLYTALIVLLLPIGMVITGIVIVIARRKK